MASHLLSNHIAKPPTPPLTPKSNSLDKLALGEEMMKTRPKAHREQSVLRLRAQLDSLPTPLLKHGLLSRTRREDPELFFSVVQADLVNLAPIVYTPTVGEACQKYSHVYSGPEGLYINIDDKDSLREILAEYDATLDAAHKPKIIVVTDGSRILGLGDLGLGGMGISVGKLNLYVAGGGIRPMGCLPIVLDIVADENSMGTNNESLREDPLYLGLRRPRVELKEAREFMDEFMGAVSAQWPKTVIQHEDFYSEAAFDFLDGYQNEYRMFNDDIQGTGSVILGGFLTAAQRASEASGRPLTDHKVVFLGGGSAAVGVAKEMMNFFRMQGSHHLYPAHKEYFIRKDTEGQEFKTLAEVVDYVQPTALVGLSTTFGAFPEEIVRKMADLNAAPIIFPLSNPTSKCELAFEDALKWTNGTVLFASGSPYPPTEYEGKLYEPGQGNNFLVFPGIGFGSIFCDADRITDGMITAAAIGLSRSLTEDEQQHQLLYPRLTRIRDVSAEVALAVVRAAQKDGVDQNVALRDLDDDQLLAKIKQTQWSPYEDEEVKSNL
ncbi:malate dehydrogenase (oxaloacetate-decarboxylating) [Trichosporon asahii var. asahii CBS 2479]|uniref:Malic enzyme n=1 Tax=Trichosporon asahii var. asahii (strain ATCC 90039 / CBS 2479 / JCM 2466 / KCTC 7840 / NBRC 103889/ NCYC 2677 / UAMH 7654) TaxID=1186058 RepID=J6ET33_TRIAS|nr:malate dehydrogenase (oxaloacetate-decarboxylating) [Trichosporon asahii var. asahii CBS 2479]EJT47719.1 malate dehydrogenase (oxaloacetate-decarboxylating) [Trichosporon asahii var. asahii CBS 2479]